MNKDKGLKMIERLLGVLPYSKISRITTPTTRLLSITFTFGHRYYIEMDRKK